MSTNTLANRVLAVGCGIGEFEGRACIGVFPSPFSYSGCAYMEARNPGTVISIGEGTWLNNGFAVLSEFSSIRIGRGALMGSKVEIIDSDFQGLKVYDRLISKPEWARAVQIKDDVFIGSNVKITKGVTIGLGAVVTNGSVVVKDVPAYTIVGGNPARVIKILELCI